MVEGVHNEAFYCKLRKLVCCTYIPLVWHTDMKVRVRWNVPIGINDVIKEKFFIVERYEEPGDIYMKFLPNDEVRVMSAEMDR